MPENKPAFSEFQDPEARRILEEIAAGADDWKDVHDTLHRHADFYFAMRPRERERLHEQVRDIARERGF